MTNDDATTPPSRRVPDPLVMPFANVRHLGFRDKVRATRLAGFGQLSLHPHEARDTIKGGLRPADMLEIAAADGVAITRLDPLSNWNPRWLPTNMDAAYIDGFDIEAAEFFELCGQLGIRYCSLNATFAPAERRDRLRHPPLRAQRIASTGAGRAPASSRCPALLIFSSYAGRRAGRRGFLRLPPDRPRSRRDHSRT